MLALSFEDIIKRYNERIVTNAARLVTSAGMWTPAVKTLHRATIAVNDRYGSRPMDGYHEQPRILYNGGVYHETGAIAADAIHIGGDHRNVPDIAAPAALQHLEGRWLYGGLLRGHFGHFIVESLARLWALPQSGATGIVFFGFNGRNASELSELAIKRRSDRILAQPFVVSMLDRLTGGLPVRCISRHTSVDDLIVPAQLMGNLKYGPGAAGHPLFRNFLHDRFGVTRRGSGDVKVYVSRSGLPHGRSRILMERCFEQELMADGYHVVHPQTMPLDDQIETYRSASRIIVANGSAAHLVAMSMQPDAAIALIAREFNKTEKFAMQLTGMGVADVTRIDTVRHVVVPERDELRAEIGWKSNGALYDVDLQAMWDELAAAGFVLPRTIPRFSDPGDLNREVDALSRHYGGVPLVLRTAAEAAIGRNRRRARAEIIRPFIDMLTEDAGPPPVASGD